MRWILLWSCFFGACHLGNAECISIAEAGRHVGEIRCVSGKVLRIERGDRGVHFLEFCENHDLCPFTAVIFADNLRGLGDVRQLVGKVVEVHGTVKLYDGRAEIILDRARQLTGDSVDIPPLPRNYDVENKGRYSAGKFSSPHKPRTASKKRQTAKLPIDLSADAMGSESSQ